MYIKGEGNACDTDPDRSGGELDWELMIGIGLHELDYGHDY